MHEVSLPVFPVLLAGGMGTRLWPVSRQLYPKQLVNFTGEDSLVQVTIKRLFSLVEPQNIRIVCGKEHTHEIARHVQEMNIDPGASIISEPCGRNTAPAILLALLTILKQTKDAIVGVFPADHVIADDNAFRDRVREAIQLAENGHIVTFGIQPSYPETGYGYIEGDNPVEKRALVIRRFVEKPDKATAEEYIRLGRFFWNSGMFMFKASVMVAEFETHQPTLLEAMSHILGRDEEPALDSYQQLDNISIDYAIMEKTEKGVVLPSRFGWSDIGSWKSLHDFIPKDDHKNVILGDVITRDTRESFIMGQSRLIAVNNVRGLAVVETPDALFISDLSDSREVKSIVDELKSAGRQEYYRHGTVYHRWGSLTQLETREGYSVERLVVYPFQITGKTEVVNSTRILLVVEGRIKAIVDADMSVLDTGDTKIIHEGHSYEIENVGDNPARVIRMTIEKGKPDAG